MSLEYYEIGGVITGGKLKLTGRERQLLEQALTQFADGYVHVRVDKAKRHRTDAQNRFWHGIVIPLFAEHCGYEFEEMKAELALQLIPKEIHRLDGSTCIVPGHTSELNVTEFNDLIRRAQQLGAEHDIYIPDPNEVAA